MTARTVETAFNAELARRLRELHPRWRQGDGVTAEQTGVIAGRPALRPDIVVGSGVGTPVVIETEFAPAQTVEADARSRIGCRLATTGQEIEQVVAARIPARLARGQTALDERIRHAVLEWCLLSGGSEPERIRRWPRSGWLRGSLGDLAETVEHAGLSESRVARGVRFLEMTVEQTAGLVRGGRDRYPDVLPRMAEMLHQEDSEQTTRMAMAVIANAFTFHTALAGSHGVAPPSACAGSPSELRTQWNEILEINYWPIFGIASRLVATLPTRLSREVIDRMIHLAEDLDALGTTTMHDLSGRMFQRLIADRKFLATFYTQPASATLLAELAVDRLDVDWAEPDEIAGRRMADMACGTGALLSAAYRAVRTRHRRAGGDDRNLHAPMIEHSLIATDIMPAATHLTASILASAHPQRTFGRTRIHTLPYGAWRTGIAIGALDLIEREQVYDLFDAGVRGVRGDARENGDVEDAVVRHNECHLAIMNPPFTRPTNHEATHANVPVPSFAGFQTTESEQAAMSERLEKTRKWLQGKGEPVAGHGNAGLASNFIDLAHAKLAPGGVLALVLPAAALQGAAWRGARELLATRYSDVTVLTVAAAGSTERAFSADTGMAEALVVATRKTGLDVEPGPVLFVNLRRRPESLLEAAWIARRTSGLPRTPGAAGALFLSDAERAPEIGGWAVSTLRAAGPAGVGNTLSMTRAMNGLFENGLLRLPRRRDGHRVAIARLRELGARGLIHRDISGAAPRGPFDIAPVSPGATPEWPVLWRHDADRERTLTVEPDTQGYARDGLRAKARQVWERTASRLHLNLDFRLNSQSLAACLTPGPTLGGRAWPNYRLDEEEWEVPVVLWANTTLGVMAFWWIASRQQQGRAILTISQTPDLPVLDPRALSGAQRRRARRIFETFETLPFLPANEAWRDESRQALDRAVFVDLLRLPEEAAESLDLLRRQWCEEPSVHGGKGTRPDAGRS